MERERKRIRNEPEIRRQVANMLELPGNAWQIVLERMEMLEIFFADHMYPEFAHWMNRRGVWQAIWKYKVVSMIPDVTQVPQIGLNARWNCMAWYFALMGSCEEPLAGYWIRSIERPNTGESIRLGFQKVVDYTGALNQGANPDLVQLDLLGVRGTDGPRIRARLLDFVDNKQIRTMRSQVLWRTNGMTDYFKSAAQILYVLLQEGFFIVLRYKDDDPQDYNIRHKIGLSL